jgi:hypothetical protein
MVVLVFMGIYQIFLFSGVLIFESMPQPHPPTICFQTIGFDMFYVYSFKKYMSVKAPPPMGE